MGKENDLMVAVKHEDVTAVRKALQKHKQNKNKKQLQKKQMNIKQPDSDGFSILHHGALSGNVEVVSALIEMDADINARDKKGMCPLHMASWAGKDTIVKTLVDSKALVNLPSFNGETALHLGAQHGYGSVVDVLLKSKADPTLRNNNFETALDLACQYGHSLVARILLRHDGVLLMLQCRQQDPRYKSPIHVAARSGHADIVRMLLECGADVNEETTEGTALHEAALFGKSDVVKMLLEAGADVGSVNKSGMTPLDIVKKFTSTRAAVEIKQLLREASGDSILFAKALMNYKNPLDSSSLTFQTGDIIMVIEQCDDGMWKGSLQNDKDAKVGTFPSSSVQTVDDSSMISSGASSSMSSVDSSLSGSSVRDQQVAFRNNRQKGSPKVQPKPVGMVPIGTYEVVALSTAQPPAPSKKQPPIPRMSSFKKKSSPPTARRETQPSNLVREQPQNQEVVTNGIHPRRNTSAADMRNGNGDVRHSQHSKSSRDSKTDPIEPIRQRTRSTSGSVTQHDLAHAAKQAIGNKLHQHGTHKQAPVVPPKHTPTNYTSVVVGNLTSNEPYNNHSDNSLRSSFKFKEDEYQTMHFDKATDDKPIKTPKNPPDVKKRQKTIMRSGYEDMTKGPEESNAPVIPQKTPIKPTTPQMVPLKDATAPITPPKIINSKAFTRRQESYENVPPRAAQPVQPPTPFEGSYGNNSATYQKPAPVSYSTPVVKPDLSTNRVETHEYRNVNVTPGAPQPDNDEPCEYSVPTANNQLQARINEHGSIRYKAPSPLSPACSSPTSSVGSNPEFEQAYLKLMADNMNEREKEMLQWLRDIKLGYYFENFHTEGYDMTSLRGISPEDLTDIDITKVGHRKKLLSQIAKLPACKFLPTKKPDDVGLWLESLGLSGYENNFIEGGFDDIDFLKDLDRHDLETIEIKKRGHQKKLLLAVRNLSDLELTASLDNVFNGENAFPSPIPSPLSPNPPIYNNTSSAFPTSSPLPLPPVADPTLQAFLLPSSTSPIPPSLRGGDSPCDAPPVLPKKVRRPSQTEDDKTTNLASSPPPGRSKSPLPKPPRTQAPPSQPSTQPAIQTERRSFKGSGKPKIEIPQRSNSPQSSPRSPINRLVNEEFRSRTTSAPVPKTKPKPKAQLNIGHVRTGAEVTNQPQSTNTPNELNQNALFGNDSHNIQRSQSVAVRPATHNDDVKVLPAKLPKPQNSLERTFSNPIEKSTKAKPPPVASKKPNRTVSPDQVRTPTPDSSCSSEASQIKDTDDVSSSTEILVAPSPDPVGAMDLLEQVSNSNEIVNAPSPEPAGGMDLLEQVLNGNDPISTSDNAPEEKPSEPSPKDDTEILMADLDDIINDFSTQLDSMFE